MSQLNQKRQVKSSKSEQNVGSSEVYGSIKKLMRKSTLESCCFFLVHGEMKHVIFKDLDHLNRDAVKLVNRLIAS